MRKSTFVIAVVLVVALCVPAVAFAALMPSPQRALSAVDGPMAVQRNDDRPTWGGEGGAQRGYHHSEGRQGTCDAFVDADGDGVCDHCAGTDGQRPGYRDADGDGACDNYGEGCPGGGHGCQNGGGRHGHGCGR